MEISTKFFAANGGSLSDVFFAVTLGEPTAKIVMEMKDKDIDPTVFEQAVFWAGSFIFTVVWCLTWVWFKKSEKVCVDYWLSQQK